MKKKLLVKRNKNVMANRFYLNWCCCGLLYPGKFLISGVSEATFSCGPYFTEQHSVMVPISLSNILIWSLFHGATISVEVGISRRTLSVVVPISRSITLPPYFTKHHVASLFTEHHVASLFHEASHCLPISRSSTLPPYFTKHHVASLFQEETLPVAVAL